MNVTLTEKQRRLRAHSVGNALASLRIESLEPTAWLLEQTRRYIEGSISMEDMLNDLKRRYPHIQTYPKSGNETE